MRLLRMWSTIKLSLLIHLSGVNGVKQSLCSKTLDAANRAHSDDKRNFNSSTPIRALYATMTFPGDKLPLDAMVPHHLRMLTSDPSRIAEVVIVANQPPWVNASSQWKAALQNVQKNVNATVHYVNYDQYNDTNYLHKFFRLQGQCPGRSKWYDGSWTDILKTVASSIFQTMGDESGDMDSVSAEGLTSFIGAHDATNFMGMLAFLERCVSAERSVELCAFFDSDIFMHRRAEKGVFDLAPAVFRDNPDLISLQPPHICDDQKLGPENKYSCPVRHEVWNSQRYLVINRTRLQSLLPLVMQPGMTERHQGFRCAFEHVWSDTVRQLNGLGWMFCGGEAFVIHPAGSMTPCDPSLEEHMQALAESEAASAIQVGENETKGISTDRIIRGIGCLVGNSLGYTAKSNVSPETIHRGASILIRRLESHKYKRTAENGCEDMGPSLPRVRSGSAWVQLDALNFRSRN